jgi:2-isopropylmalate synthase
MTPQSIGIKESSLPLGKLSGRHALKEKLKGLGYTLLDDDLNLVFTRFKDLADRKKHIFDEDLESLVEMEVLRRSVPEHFKLVELVVLTGTMAKPTATVKLEIDGEIHRYSSFGDGPIDATFKAITHLTKTECRLLKFAVSSITGGTDALGEITVKLEEDGNVVTGRGVDPDIVTASARAFLNGLNRLYYVQMAVTAGDV